MRKNVLILTLFISAVFTQAQDKSVLDMKYNLEVKNQKLNDVLDLIEHQFNIKFSYSSKVIDLEKIISIKVKERALRKILEELFDDSDIGFKQIGNQIVLSEHIQRFVQTIRGKVVDTETQQPLFGVAVAVLGTSPLKGAVSDFDGYFKIEEVPIGRYDIRASYMGYATNVKIEEIVTSGKELVLEFEMKEMGISVEAIVIQATNKKEPSNSSVLTSGRSFSVEETKRLAGGLSDPAKTATAFAGVSYGSYGISNDISVKGNAVRYNTYIIEGMEVIQPSHFKNVWIAGGLTMLNNSMLGTSDLLVAAYPAEYGNAMAGIFDLRYKTGNSEKREHTFKFGFYGLEASTEGYFKKGSRGSYNVNYRYGLLKLLKSANLIGSQVGLPVYEDISFKIKLPTVKLGTFSIFGMKGSSEINLNPDLSTIDTSFIKTEDDIKTYSFINKYAILSLSHNYFLSKKAYIKTTLGVSTSKGVLTAGFPNHRDNFDLVVDVLDESYQELYKAKFVLNKKLNQQNSIKIGMDNSGYGLSAHGYRNYIGFDNISDLNTTYKLNYLIRAFAQWKHNFSDSLMMVAGIHSAKLLLNNTFSIEPRFAIKYVIDEKQQLAFASGKYSKMEDIRTYYIQRRNKNGAYYFPNMNIDLGKSIHNVLSYSRGLNEYWKLKIELFHEYLYDISVEDNATSTRASINASGFNDIYYMDSLVSNGMARNVGYDITLDRFFNHN